MRAECVWEHNGGSSLLYSCGFIGAYARGGTLEEAAGKMPEEIRSYILWLEERKLSGDVEVVVTQEQASELNIADADSDVLFDCEQPPLSMEEYLRLKSAALKSAVCFQRLYDAIPDKNAGVLPARKTFYGPVPRTAEQMYVHTRDVNPYYFEEIGVTADRAGGIAECRSRGFQMLEQSGGFLRNETFAGSYGELWTLRKVCRRFVWHDRIHAKAMFRLARKLYSGGFSENPFCFPE